MCLRQDDKRETKPEDKSSQWHFFTWTCIYMRTQEREIIVDIKSGLLFLFFACYSVLYMCTYRLYVCVKMKREEREK